MQIEIKLQPWDNLKHDTRGCQGNPPGGCLGIFRNKMERKHYNEQWIVGIFWEGLDNQSVLGGKKNHSSITWLLNKKGTKVSSLPNQAEFMMNKKFNIMLTYY